MPRPASSARSHCGATASIEWRSSTTRLRAAPPTAARSSGSSTRRRIARATSTGSAAWKPVTPSSMSGRCAGRRRTGCPRRAASSQRSWLRPSRHGCVPGRVEDDVEDAHRRRDLLGQHARDREAALRRDRARRRRPRRRRRWPMLTKFVTSADAHHRRDLRQPRQHLLDGDAYVPAQPMLTVSCGGPRQRVRPQVDAVLADERPRVEPRVALGDVAASRRSRRRRCRAASRSAPAPRGRSRSRAGGSRRRRRPSSRRPGASGSSVEPALLRRRLHDDDAVARRGRARPRAEPHLAAAERSSAAAASRARTSRSRARSPAASRGGSKLASADWATKRTSRRRPSTARARAAAIGTPAHFCRR